MAVEENTNTRTQLKHSLYLLSLIDGLHEGRYFDFVQGLLSITFRLLELPVDGQGTFSLVDWLLTELPAISAHYARGFALVDPHLNTVMVTAYDVLLTIAGFPVDEPDVQELVEGQAEEPSAADDESGDEPAVGEVRNEPDIREMEIRASRVALANAVAQLALMIPDMAYYFDTPVRARMVREVNTCISMAARLDESGSPAMTRGQFESCMETLLRSGRQGNPSR